MKYRELDYGWLMSEIMKKYAENRLSDSILSIIRRILTENKIILEDGGIGDVVAILIPLDETGAIKKIVEHEYTHPYIPLMYTDSVKIADTTRQSLESRYGVKTSR